MNMDVTTIDTDCPVCQRPVMVAVRRDGRKAVTVCAHCDLSRFETQTVDGKTRMSVTTGKTGKNEQ
jgi:transcription elongation factor Elf1